tara:strand:- start:43 stop:516 length:474 start_codon:yes stop_codon:yes gene_type:complete
MLEKEFPKGFEAKIKKLEDFFGIKLNSLPKVIEVESRKEMDSFHNKPTEEWFVACVKEEKIVIFSKESMEEHTSHRKEEYEKLLIHELCHIFYGNRQKTFLPMWLNEGIALNLAEQKKQKIDVSVNDVLNLVTQEQFQNDPQAYSKSYWLVNKLLEK